MSVTLKDLLQEAKEKEYALGHFNFSDSTALNAIVTTCKKLGSPAFVAVSEGEGNFLGYRQAVQLVKAWREEAGIPVFLNADHHKTLESVKKAIDAGFDSVQIDEMSLSFEENIVISRKAVEYAKGKNPDISVEGGLGYFRTQSSEVYKEFIEVKPEDMTSAEEAQEFVEKTGVDRLAIVIGNIHGISLGGNPRLNLTRLREIHDAISGLPLTLHGGSGIDDKDIVGSLSLGITNIHINTELRVAYHDALVQEFKKAPDQTTPYKFLAPSLDAISRVVEKKLKLFNAVNVL